MLRINLRLSTLFAVDEETGSSAPARAAPTSAEPAGRDAEAEATP
jgi:hypothetical protein